jgi:hypothetical protein
MHHPDGQGEVIKIHSKRFWLYSLRLFHWCLHCFGGGDVGASSNSIVGELLVHADGDSRVERDSRDQERLEARQAVLFDRFAQLADSVLDCRRQAVVEVGFSLVASLERRSWKVRVLGEVVAVGKWIYGATESWSCALSRK